MQWFSGSIPEAVAEAKRNNKLFLVYIEGTDEMSKEMTRTYDDQTVSQKLTSGSVVALKLAANSVPYVQFCAIYPVLVIPSSYFIGANGSPIEIITGSLLPSEFSAKIDKVLEVHGKGHVVQEKELEAIASVKESSAAASSSQSTENALASDKPSTSHASETDTEHPLQERLDRAKALLEAQRHSKAVEEKEKEKRDEIERRNVGKAVQQAQKTKQENELKEWAKNRAKEKEEERLAREKVRAMIAQDRAERAAKYQQVKEAEQAERDRIAQIREEQERAARNAAMNSNDARIQFRLPDGSSMSHSFSADSTLEEARQFVINVVRPPFSNFSLCTTFPRRHFTEVNYAETLRDLQLAPSAVLLILPSQAVASVSSNGGFLSNLFWMILSPFTSVWRLLMSFFPGSDQNANQTTPSAAPSNTQQGASTSQSTNSNSQSGVRKREGTFYKREGNVFRINNQSDDDENNTWNGNSTQQM